MDMIAIFREQIMQQWEFVLRIVLGVILGCCIGFERKNRNKMAGIRTHAIVALGSALMIIISKYGFYDIANYDASRVAAQIVSGVGFLGAGIIFVRNNNSVSGLTTAAGIWATAGVGMAAGAGQYFIAVSSTILLVLLQVILHKVHFLAKEAYRGSVKVILNEGVGDVKNLEDYIMREKISITSLKVSKQDKDNTKIEMNLLFPGDCDKTEFINRLAQRREVISVRG